jgi:hypothetical protein
MTSEKLFPPHPTLLDACNAVTSDDDGQIENLILSSILQIFSGFGNPQACNHKTVCLQMKASSPLRRPQAL